MPAGWRCCLHGNKSFRDEQPFMSLFCSSLWEEQGVRPACMAANGFMQHQCGAGALQRLTTMACHEGVVAAQPGAGIH